MPAKSTRTKGRKQTKTTKKSAKTTKKAAKGKTTAKRKASPASANKRANRRFFTEVVNKGNIDLIDQLCAPDFVEHEQMPPGIPPTVAGVKQWFAQMRSAFPDLTVAIDKEVADRDTVVTVSTWTGTHRADFLGLPATGRKVTFRVIDVVQFKRGKAVAHWGVSDTAALMQQIQPATPLVVPVA